jgi:hypothetical protein
MTVRKTRAFAAVLCAAVGILGTAEAGAAGTRDELLFALRVALKTHDPAGIGRCFHLDGLDEISRESLASTIDQICMWPEPYVFTTDRKDRGPLEIVRDGRRYTLNGQWTFQVHIHKGKPPSKGFVFPAGATPDGKILILTSVPR